MSSPNSTPAGWFPDPRDSQRLIYWDGRNWTGHSHPAFPSAPALGPRGTSAPPLATRPWWQTWLAIVPGLLICLPLGLIGLWRRNGTSTAVKTAVTAGTVLLLGIGSVTSNDPVSTTSAVPSVGPSANPSAPPVTPSITPSPSPSAFPSASPSPSLARVPDIEGLDLVDAKRALRAAGLEIGEVDRRPSSKRKGTVLEQDVGEGKELEPDSSVSVVVASPLPTVPSVVDRSKESAVEKLKDAGFKVKTITRIRTTGQDGVVLRQSPAGGNRAKPRSVVRIVISDVQRAPDVSEESDNCTPGYSPCLPPESDYDCRGGSGNGPGYVDGSVRVTGPDIYDLDRDGDGVGCD